jgi:hypothetical protein
VPMKPAARPCRSTTPYCRILKPESERARSNMLNDARRRDAHAEQGHALVSTGCIRRRSCIDTAKARRLTIHEGDGYGRDARGDGAAHLLGRLIGGDDRVSGSRRTRTSRAKEKKSGCVKSSNGHCRHRAAGPFIARRRKCPTPRPRAGNAPHAGKPSSSVPFFTDSL